MAACVVAATYDAEEGLVALACNVHCSFALPCQHDGEPAKQSALHALAVVPREETLAFWQRRTRGQRPLVIHCAAWQGEHRATDEWPYPGCPCGGEVLFAVDGGA